MAVAYSSVTVEVLENFFVQLLYHKLRDALVGIEYFMDLDSIDLGVDFHEVVDQQLSQCSIMLVIIKRLAKCCWT